MSTDEPDEPDGAPVDPGEPGEPDDEPGRAEATEDSGDSSRRTRRRRRSREAEIEDAEREERITARIATHWAQIREERRAEPQPIATGSSNFTRAQVPWGVDLAAAWAWRFLVIVGAGYLVVQALVRLSEITVPLAIALLIAALVSPIVNTLTRVGVPRGPASLATVLCTLAALAAMLTLAGRQIANDANDLATRTADGLGEIRDWLKTGPLHASDSQINEYIQKAQDQILKQVNEGSLTSRVTEVTATVSHVFAGLFIVLFATYFFLADGDRIWAWLVRLTPRAARARVDSSGRVAWTSLVQFVRATVIVAATDAIGVMVGAAILGIGFVFPIGLLVFLGAFVPLVGAFVAGGVAVLVALVAKGPVVALIMLGVVVLVQQLESHVLQPFLMGRWVAIHPLGVILAIATGIILGGIVGALIAVPLTAVVNGVVTHLAGFTTPGRDPRTELDEDYTDENASEPMEDRSGEQQR